jgi:cytoskeletal protein RodZ
VLSLTELGNRLKEARIAKGLSLEELQTITKIQKRYLVGIEEGNYSSMPGKFYVRAFIKQYAEAVGIQPEELFEQYKSEIPSSTYTDEIPEKLSRVQSRKDISGGNSKIFEFLPKILIGVFILGAVALAYYLLPKNTGDDLVDEPATEENQTVNIEESESLEKAKEEEKAEEDNEAEQAEEEKEETEPEPEIPAQQIEVAQTSGNETTYELKDAENFVLKVVSKGETWVNILNGKGYSFYQGMLTKDGTAEQTVDFTKETEAIIVVGNAADTEIFVNDEKLEYATSPADIVRQDITIRYVPTAE